MQTRMCNHNYTGAYSGDDDIRCNNAELFAEWAAAFPGSNAEGSIKGTLPVDAEGVCIFHSKDIAFKIEHDLTYWLDLLFYHSKDHTVTTTIDCREFVVTGVYEEAAAGASYTDEALSWKLTGYKTYKKLDARFSEFHCSIKLDNCAFSDVDLTGAVCHTDLEVTNSDIKSFTMVDVVANAISIEGSNFAPAFVANRIRVTGSLSLADNSFHSNFMMLHADISGQIATFEFNHFGMAYFDDSVFSCHVSFNDSTFARETSFQRVVFRDQTYFTNISILNTFLLSGVSRESRCFDGQVEWSFKEVTGVIKLENVNYLHFDRSSKDLFDKLGEEKKAEIGPGCLTYASSLSFEVHLLSSLHYFCEEVARTFGLYFQLFSGIHLGIHVKKVSGDRLHVVYFSDEVMSDKIFADKIRAAQHQLHKLLQKRTIPVSEGMVSEHYATILDLWAKSKFNFVRAGLAINTRGIEEPTSVIPELFKPLYGQTELGGHFYITRTIEETRSSFPSINLHIDMSTYNVNNNQHSQIQVGAGTQIIHNTDASLSAAQTLADLKGQVERLSDLSDRQSTIVMEILKELEVQNATDGMKVDTYQRLKDQLNTAAAISGIGSLLVSLEQLVK